MTAGDSQLLAPLIIEGDSLPVRSGAPAYDLLPPRRPVELLQGGNGGLARKVELIFYFSFHTDASTISQTIITQTKT